MLSVLEYQIQQGDEVEVVCLLRKNCSYYSLQVTGMIKDYPTFRYSEPVMFVIGIFSFPVEEPNCLATSTCGWYTCNTSVKGNMSCASRHANISMSPSTVNSVAKFDENKTDRDARKKGYRVQQLP